MTRIKRGVSSHFKHKKVLKSTKGFRGTKNRLIKVAKEASLHAGHYAYAGRKNRKRDFRSLWITRISEAVKPFGISYSVFMYKMKKEKILLNRKMLSYMVTNDPEAFKSVVEKVKSV